MSGERRPLRLGLGILALILVLGIGLVWLNRGGGAEFSYFHEKAAGLDFDRDRIVAFVRDEVSPEACPGSSRGALGALWGKAGNAEDRSRLLKALLAEAEVESELVGSGVHRGVRLSESGEVIVMGAGSPADWQPVESKPDFSIRFSGDNSENEFRGRVADYLRSPLRVSADGKTASVIDGSGSVLWEGGYDPSDGFSMHLTFSLSGGDPVRVWRELVPQGGTGGERSEHAVVFAPCEIDLFVFEKQAELVAADWADSPGVSDAYQLALSHWFQSDRALVDLKSHYEADAWYTVPRVLIGSVYFDGDDVEPSGYALDLRKNDIHIEADEETKLPFALARAALEADLEARVLMEATGRRGRSAIDVMLAQLGDWAPSSARRISDYEMTLTGFLRDTHPGSVLAFSVGEGLKVELTRLDGEDAVGIELSEALNARLEEIDGLPWEVMKAGKATPAQFAEFSVELETLLGAASATGFDYQPGVELGHSPALVKSPHVRRFQYRRDEEKKELRVSFEQQITKVNEDGSYSYEVIDYWDEINERWQNNPIRYDVPLETYLSGNGYSHWHSSSTMRQGCNPFALGLEAFGELKEKGVTEVVAYLHDDSATEPIRLYVVEEFEFPLTINQRKVMAPALSVGGRPVSEDRGKQEWNDIEAMDDPATPYPDDFNRFIILDDPELPLIVNSSESFQASVSGKVLVEGDETPVGDAEVQVAQAGVSTRSWPTGDFVLPIIKKPFAEFTVTVSHPDFEPWSETLDFQSLKTFTKLNKIRLTPRPPTDRFTWIEPESLEEGLAEVTDEQMARFVRQSLTDNPALQALVPLQEVPIGFDSDTAWLLLDRNSGHMTAVTSDGLHGMVGGEVAQELQGGAVSAYSGYIASWYAYAGGKLDAMTDAMRGGDFSDLGHEHAKAFALRFLGRMMAATDNVFAEQAGVNSAAYKAGFLKGLEFFDAHPEYRGE